MRKIYLVPNIVTTLGMFCGFYAVVAATQSQFVIAAWAVVFAGVFDMLDGRIARLAKATSNFGVEYDSLADLISFGMAPSVLLYLWAFEPFGRLGWLAAFLFLACGALRLARFNVRVNSIPKSYFQGIPIPVAAGVVVTFVIFNDAIAWLAGKELRYFTLALSLALSSLMVSNLPFPSFKELNWRSKASFGYLLVGVMILVLIAVRPEVTLFLAGCSYVVFGLFWSFTRNMKKRRTSERAGYVKRS